MSRVLGTSTLLMLTLALCGCGMNSEVKNDPLFQPTDDVYKAATAGDVEAVRYYVTEYSWDPSVTNYDGRLPLSYAAENGNLEIIQIMVQAGADVNLSDSSGKTPLQYAKDAGNDEAVQYLQELGATQ